MDRAVQRRLSIVTFAAYLLNLVLVIFANIWGIQRSKEYGNFQ